MRRTMQRLSALVMALAAALALFIIPASAVAGTTASFDCYLIVDEDETIPGITFEYTIAPGAAIPQNGTAAAVSAGPVVMDGDNMTAPTIGTAAFTAGETAANSVTGSDTVTLASGEKYAKKQVSIDFTGVSFTAAGIYRYVITEQTIDGNRSVSYDTQVGNGGTARTRYLDVYIGDSDTGLAVAAYVLHKTTDVGSSSAEGGETDKSAGFVNRFTAYDFTFGKEVTGNQGSKDKYFKFTLLLGNLPAGAAYAVDLSGASPTVPSDAASTDANYKGKSNPGTVLASSDTVDFYLKDGQYITVKGLPPAFTYALSETTEEYTSQIGIAASENAANTAHNDAVENTNGVNADVKTGFTNHRAGVIPTGILLTIAPFAAGLLLFGALFFFMAARNKRKR